MRFINMISMAVIILISAGFAADVLLLEDLEDMGAEGWTMKTPANWKIIKDEGDYSWHQWNTNPSGSDPLINEWAVYDRTVYDNYSFSVQVRTGENLDINPAADFGLLFHYQDSKNFYYVSFSSKEQETVLTLRKNGVDKVLARCAESMIVSNDYRTISVTTLNGNITVITHDQKIFQFYDTTFLKGKVGVGMIDDAAYFDYLLVCKNAASTCDFSDNFNDRSTDGWTALTPSRWNTKVHWDQSCGLFLNTSTYSNPKDDLLGEIITTNNVNAENFTFECDIMSYEGMSNGTADLAVVWCYIDEMNYYYAVFNREPNHTRFVRVFNNSPKVINSYSGKTINDENWHRIKVVGQNKYYKIYYDDTLILQEYESYLVGGKVGFGSLNDSGMFDNVCISGSNIIQESITLHAPNGGETLKAGQIFNINWSSQNVSNNVSLQYTTDGGSNWTTIISSTLNDYSYDWSVPDVNSTKCKILISDVDGTPSDASNSFFTIQPLGTISVVAPNGGETLMGGQSYNIEWNSAFNSGTVKIEYSTNGGSSWSTIVSSTVDDGSHPWTVPNVNSSNCYIRITDTDGNPSDVSDRAFTIKPAGVITVLAPNGGETFAGGDVVNVQWKSTDNSGQVKIDYTTTGGSSWIPIASGAADTGSYLWTIPNVSSTNCKVRVMDSDGSPSDMSDNPFTIKPAGTLSVVAPNGGETLTAGSNYTIRWNSANNSGQVKLELTTNNGSTWSLISASEPDNGSYIWKVPEISSTSCKVRITDVDGSPSDAGDNVFTIMIPKTLAVSRPNGGEKWIMGNSESITWSSNAGGDVKIDLFNLENLSRTIIAKTANNGLFYWNIPMELHASSQYRVRISSLSEPTLFDFSDGYFELLKPSNNPPLKPIYANTAVNAGSDFWIDVQGGEEGKPVHDLFGISFNLTISPVELISVVEPFGDNVKPGAFLGTDLIFYQNVEKMNGVVSVGISRKAGSGGVNGFGSVLRVHIKVANTAQTDQLLTVAISETAASNSSGETVNFDVKSLQLKVRNGLGVWPGDSDNNGMVNQADILPIGLYWMKTGAARLNASMIWTGQICPTPWNPEKATYADCNGDGVVNQADVLAIGLNWNKTHSVSLAKASKAEYNTMVPTTVKMNWSGFGTISDPYYLDIQVEDVRELLGISFEMMVSENSKYVSFQSVVYSDFFGNDLIHFESINNDAPSVSVGATRKADAGGVSGTGSLCRIYFQVAEDVPKGEFITFSLQNVSANNAQGEAIQLEYENTKMMTNIAHQAIIPQELTISQNYPNPFNPSTLIEYQLPHETFVTVEIFNTLGQRVKTLGEGSQLPGIHTVQWDGTDDNGLAVSQGIYLCRLTDGQGLVRMIKMAFAK